MFRCGPNCSPIGRGGRRATQFAVPAAVPGAGATPVERNCL